MNDDDVDIDTPSRYDDVPWHVDHLPAEFTLRADCRRPELLLHGHGYMLVIDGDRLAECNPSLLDLLDSAKRTPPKTRYLIVRCIDRAVVATSGGAAEWVSSQHVKHQRTGHEGHESTRGSRFSTPRYGRQDRALTG